MTQASVIPYGKQSISGADIDAVVNVLQSERLTQGPAVPLFEKALAGYCDARGAVAVSSGTSALHIACLALGLGAGDWLWTSPISFVASANCGLYCGAKVDFVDVDPVSGNLSVVELENKLRQAEKHGTLPKVLIVVHMAGSPCAMETIHALATHYGVAVIEDASHALGARYQGNPVGDCRYSDLTVFSFHPVKTITSAEGGAVLSQNTALLDTLRLLRSHGICRTEQASAPVYYYEQQLLGWNYRLSDIHAALALSQLNRCDDFVKQRHFLAQQYQEQLLGLPCDTVPAVAETQSSYHLFRILVEPVSRDSLFTHLHASGIGVQVHYIPIHTQPYYRARGFDWGDFPQAEDYYQRVLSLPLFPDLSLEMQRRVVHELEAFWR